MKQIRTEDAVGHILCHDITQIIKDVKKGVVFKKGHKVREEDIPVLLSVGKEHLYIWENNDKVMHEDEAATLLYKLCKNQWIDTKGEISEGKIELFATCEGLLKVNVSALEELNSYDDIVVATRHHHTPLKQGDKVAGMRVVPLVIDKEKMHHIEQVFNDTTFFELRPYKKWRVGIVTTGSEVFKGRIQDAFGPVIRAKLKEYNVECIGQQIVDDQEVMIQEAIQQFIDAGANMIICTGGMSVDPDDVTPTAIQSIGAELISYGAPVLPGAMFLLAYKGEIPIMGLPGCVMYAKRTVFDLVLPRVLIGEKLTKRDLARFGHGGLCLGCESCHYPNCSFGKGN